MDITKIKPGMELIGADGVHVGTVDAVEGSYVKLTKKDSGQGHEPHHHHYLEVGLVSEIEGDKIRLSAKADVAVSFEEHKKSTGSLRQSAALPAFRDARGTETFMRGGPAFGLLFAFGIGFVAGWLLRPSPTTTLSTPESRYRTAYDPHYY